MTSPIKFKTLYTSLTEDNSKLKPINTMNAFEKTIKFTNTAKGRRAFYLSNYAYSLRWLPMKLAEAELLIATGKAELYEE